MEGDQNNGKTNKNEVELTSDKVQWSYLNEFHPHILSGADVMRYLKVNEKMGLSQENVIAKHKKYGFNELKHEEKKTIISLFLEQFEDFLTRILLGAAFLSFLITFFSEEAAVGFTAYVEPIVIFLILVANSCVSVWQECRAEKSLEALKKLQPELAWVLRDGQYQNVKSCELVIGDLCMIRVGDCVPADMRVIKITSLSLTVEQSQFTGESAPVEKIIEPLDPSMSLCELQAKNNMVFSSTKVVNGTALCVVTATGMGTELGKIQSAVHLASLEEEPSPLQKKLNDFGKLLSKIIGGICILVWVINYKNFSDPSHGGIARGCVYYFKTAVALAVAAIPEGLTAVITSCLALGTVRMARKNAIVRKLNSVETLGCTTVICTDKTGTLTTNEMSCVRFAIVSNDTTLQEYMVDGISYTPVGKIYDSSLMSRPFHHIDTKDTALQYFAACACLCNETRLCIAREPTGIRYTLHGEPTEAALKVLVEKMGCPDMSLNMINLQKMNRENPEVFSNYWADRFERLVVLEFTRDRKCMSVFCEDNLLNKPTQFVKGAPESILQRCSSLMLPDGTVTPMTKTMLDTVSSELQAMEKKALRVLALAVSLSPFVQVRKMDSDATRKMKFQGPDTYTLYEKDLTFLGLVGLLDPPRTEIREAISICRVAGVKVNMLTGDSQKTAESVAIMTGILQHENIQMASITGRDFSNLSIKEQYHLLSQPFGIVFSRTEPRHKQMIIRLLNDLGEVTAMTGDGVNDAPALKQADIGISMGITGTEVAKEASDIVLADDNFMTIVLAIEEGRSIYNNMKAFIRYLISSNIGEVASIFLTSALGVPEGLAPVQLLWVNLVTDGFPATALGFNPPEKDVMKKPPRRSEDTLISHWHLLRYLIIGLYVGIATVGILISWYISEDFMQDGHTRISYYQLSHWTQCHTWKNFKVTPIYSMDPKNPCTFFTQGKIKASTLSLTVLIVIEMLNALNALSEDGSLFNFPPWSNPFLVLAIVGSLSLHCLILYHPTLNVIVGVTALSMNDWFHVLLWSLPVLLIDEVIKVYGRYKTYYSQLQSQRHKSL